MSMLLLEDILTKIKNCIDVPYSLGYNLDEDDTDSAIDPVRDCLYEAGLNKECDIANGVSKVVIIPRNSAYVIKTPLFGSWYYPEEYDEKSDEYYTFINNEAKYFECSLGTISYNDFLEDRPLEELERLKSKERLIYDYHEALKKVEG